MVTEAVTITACPACHGTDAPQVGAAASGFDTLVAGRHFHQPPYAVHACQACGLYFKSAVLAPAELDAYYAALDSAPFEIDGDYPTDRLVHERLRALPDGSRVLDYGCSTGRILRPVAARLECVGVEPNEAAAATARARGIRIVGASELSDAAPFDAILLTDVFEHLADPVPLLQHLAGKLAPRGWLGIVTGNADAIEPRDWLAEFWYFRLPGHVIMLGERHLSWLATELGLGLIQVDRCSHYRVPLVDRVRQGIQAFAYRQFRTAPRGVAARVLRRTPRLSAAQRWTTAPTLSYRNDHVVAIFERSPR
jgi:SAM-dependent methyltransferase